jgi:hypothetical protein
MTSIAAGTGVFQSAVSQRLHLAHLCLKFELEIPIGRHFGAGLGCGKRTGICGPILLEGNMSFVHFEQEEY